MGRFWLSNLISSGVRNDLRLVPRFLMCYFLILGFYSFRLTQFCSSLSMQPILRYISSAVSGNFW